MLKARILMIATATAVAFTMLGTPVQAQQSWMDRPFVGKSAGDIVVRGRVIGIAPDESSRIDPIGGRALVGDAVVPELDFSYFFTDNIAAELVLATAKHDVEAKQTALGDVDLGDVKLLPPTLTLQYHFQPKQRFSPYVGAGVNYTVFYDADSGGVDSVNYDNSFGAAFQVGIDVALTGRWFLNADVKKLLLSTDVKVNGDAARADVDIDPWIFGLGAGYRF